jgi:hypothetical protein
MAALNFNPNLKLATLTLAAIEAAGVRLAENGFRPHLGASAIGKKCERALWYSFRWARVASFDARVLRLFARGQREEDPFAALLRTAGITIHQVEQGTGQQFRFSDCGGHFGGSMDGACVGVPDAPKTWHVWECKTASKKMFDDLVSKGVKESKPEHWSQMQCYMHWTGMERALYTSVCKDDDRLHLERVEYDASAATKLVEKAQRIIDAPEPPERIGDASWYECKFCDFHSVCHGTEAPAVNCRTCAHSTPERDGTWSCAGTGNALNVQEQNAGCIEHRYIPATIKHWAEVVNANHEQNWVEYQHINAGSKFINGPGPDGFSSKEIHAAADKAGLGMVAADEYLMNLRKQFGAEVVG